MVTSLRDHKTYIKTLFNCYCYFFFDSAVDGLGVRQYITFSLTDASVRVGIFSSVRLRQKEATGANRCKPVIAENDVGCGGKKKRASCHCKHHFTKVDT